MHRIKPPIQAGCPALWEYLEDRLEKARDKVFFGALGKT
jgi:putative hydrolase of HD superfamily